MPSTQEKTAGLLDNPSFAHAIEQNEMGYWRKLYNETAGALRHCLEIEGAVACSMPAVDILAFNRVLGLGTGRPVSERQLELLINYYRSRGVARFFAPLSPKALSENAAALLEAYGFQHYNSWAKLIRSLDKPLPPVQTELEIIEMTPGWAGTFEAIICDSFQWPRTIGRAFGDTVGTDGYRHYLALHNGVPVAAAALYVHRPFASMAIAGTLPEYRGMGAQSLLLATRLADATRMGCRFAIVETAAGTPGEPVASYRNMRRFGFELAYLRPNFLFSFR